MTRLRAGYGAAGEGTSHLANWRVGDLANEEEAGPIDGEGRGGRAVSTKLKALSPAEGRRGEGSAYVPQSPDFRRR